MNDELAPFRIVFDDREALSEAWKAGLHRGVVTPRSDGRREIGACEVIIEVPFAGLSCRVEGEVFHAGRVMTIVRLAEIPVELEAIAKGAANPASRVSAARERARASSDGSARSTAGDGASRGSVSQDEPPGGRPSYWALRLKKDDAKRRATPDRSPEKRGRGARRTAPLDATKFDATDSIVQGPGLPIPGTDERLIPGVGLFDGDLEKTSPFALFIQIYCQALTGVCVLDAGDRRYWAYFVQGRPIHYERRPALRSESVESVLLRRKILAQPILERALWHAAITAVPVPMVIRQLELVEPARLDQALVEYLELLTRRLMDWDRGSFRFFEASDLHRLFRNRSLEPLELLWSRAILRFANLSASQANSQLNEILPLFASLSNEGRELMDRLPLQEPQRRELERLRRPNRRVRKVVRSGDLTHREATELILAARLLGLIDLSATGPETRSEADQEKERKLRERLAKMHLDHFRFLGLHWAALPWEIEAACDLLAEEVRGFGAIGGDITNFSSIRNDLLARIEQLRQLTRSLEKRRDYRLDLLGETELLMATENYLDRGEMALFKNDDAEARDCFERVLEIEPGGVGSHARVKRAREVLAKVRRRS